MLRLDFSKKERRIVGRKGGREREEKRERGARARSEGGGRIEKIIQRYRP